MTRFQLLDTTTVQVTPRLFGMWEEASGGPISFAAPGASDEIPVWSVNVSADPRLATSQLDAGLEQVTSASEALSEAQTRIEALVKNSPGVGEVSFAAPGVPLPPAERELMTALEHLKASERGAVSFGLLPDGIDLAEAENKFKTVLARLTQSLAYYAFVETLIEGRLLCRTTLNWSSDTRTVWQSGLAVEQWALHRRTLELSVQSRATLMRTVALTVQSAIKISTLLAMPGGALLALPATWKFINEVLQEVDQPRDILSS
ncbi:MAG: hypothetical protein ACT4QE_02320 [Anaerolineales bacterium]